MAKDSTRTVSPIPIDPPSNYDFQEIQNTIFTPICSAVPYRRQRAAGPAARRRPTATPCSVNVASAEVPALLRVNPGNPDQSYLVQKIQGNAAVGGRMPLGQAALPQDRIDLIRSWIAAGAPPAACASNNLTRDQQRCRRRAKWRRPASRKLTVIFSARCRRLARVQRHLRAARRIRSARGDRPRSGAGRAAPTWSRLTLAQASPPAATSSRCAATAPWRSPTTPVTCSTATPTASPVVITLMSFDVSAGATR